MYENASFNRVMLGKSSMYAEEYLEGNFIGGDWSINADLSDHLSDVMRPFNEQFIPVFL